MISTRDLSALPDVDRLRRVLQSMAMLDAVLCPEANFRYYSFNAAWSAGEQVGSMHSGTGDDFYAHFSAAGCWLKGFVHECSMSPFHKHPPRPWPGVLESIPAEFVDCLQEPAFEAEVATFCIWRRCADVAWQVGPVEFPPNDRDPDGSALLLSALDGRPESYSTWASHYYEREVKLSAVEHVYRHLPLTHNAVAQLNPDVTLGKLAADIKEIAYPTRQQTR